MNCDNDIKKLLGRRIKELRIKKGLTQENLAEKVDIGQRSLSRIECGKIFITSETLSKLLTVFEIEASELFNFKHLDETKELKKELIEAINDEKVDIKLLYQFYRSLR